MVKVKVKRGQETQVSAENVAEGHIAPVDEPRQDGDPTATGASPPPGEPPVEDAGLQQKVQELEAELRESQEKYLRAMAEFDNARKRMRTEKDDAIDYANSNLILALLPILDNFELALQHSEGKGDFDNLVKGVKQILKQMKETLQKQGVEPIEALGKPFDPEEHEAIGHVESDEFAEGAVAQEVRTGYRLKGRNIRPTLVRVAGGG